MYKLIVSDFDGTIADHNREISHSVESAIKKWINTKRMFTIATGRQFAMIKHITERLHLTIPVIVRGGAEIVDPKTGKILKKWYMEKESIKKMIAMLKKHNISFLLEKDNVVYRNNELRKQYEFLEYRTVDEIPFEDFPKCVLYIQEGTENIIDTFVHDHLAPQFPELHFVKNCGPQGKAWDITSQQATKHLGVLHLIDMLRIKREEVVGVGDGMNDYPLLTAAGYKVAMENAPEELKSIADLVVLSYKEDGVAVLIHKLLEESK